MKVKGSIHRNHSMGIAGIQYVGGFLGEGGWGVEFVGRDRYCCESISLCKGVGVFVWFSRSMCGRRQRGGRLC